MCIHVRQFQSLQKPTNFSCQDGREMCSHLQTPQQRCFLPENATFSLSLSLSLSFPPETLKCSYKLTHFSCQDEREMCGHVHMPEQRRLCQWNETFFFLNFFFVHLKPWSVVPTVTQLADRMIVAHKAVSSWDSRTDQSLPPFPRSTNVWYIYRLDNNWSKNLLYNSCSTVTKWIKKKKKNFSVEKLRTIVSEWI